MKRRFKVIRLVLSLRMLVTALATVSCVDSERAIRSLEDNNATLKDLAQKMDSRAAALEKPLSDMTANIAKLSETLDERSGQLISLANQFAKLAESIDPSQFQQLSQSLNVLSNFVSQFAPEDLAKYGKDLGTLTASLGDLNKNFVERMDYWQQEFANSKNLLAPLVKQFGAGWMLLSKVAGSMQFISENQKDEFLNLFSQSTTSLIELLSPMGQTMKSDIETIQKLAKELQDQSDEHPAWLDIAGRFLKKLDELDQGLDAMHGSLDEALKIPDQLNKEIGKTLGEVGHLIDKLDMKSLNTNLKTMNKHMSQFTGLVGKHQKTVELSASQLIEMHRYWKGLMSGEPKRKPRTGNKAVDERNEKEYQEECAQFEREFPNWHEWKKKFDQRGAQVDRIMTELFGDQKNPGLLQQLLDNMKGMQATMKKSWLF